MSIAAEQVSVAADAVGCGRAASRDVAAAIGAAIDQHGRARVVFASAPSQQQMLDALVCADVGWGRVEAFHMDEYLGLPDDHPSAFGPWLAARLPVERLAGFHRLDPTAGDAETESRRYESLLAAGPLDLGCLGIGVNGHIAFNEPGSDLADPRLVRPVTLDPTSRQQQVDDGCFPTVADVPVTAVSLTVPALLSCAAIVVTVPGAHKAAAVAAAIDGPVDPACPASALQTHDRVRVHLDAGSASLLATP